jgi:hypothetical protein
MVATHGVSTPSRTVAGTLAWLLLVAGLAAVVAPPAAAAAGGTMTLPSADPGGAPGAAPSRDAAVTADGRYVAFLSDAPLLDADAGGLDVYRRDTAEGALALVSVARFLPPLVDEGTGAETPWTVLDRGVAISADGALVAFVAQPPVEGEGGQPVLVVADLRPETPTFTEVVPTERDAAIPLGGPDSPSFDVNGERLAFRAGRPGTVEPPQPGTQQIRVARIDRRAGVAVTGVDLVTADPEGQPVRGAFDAPALDPSGTWVAVSTDALDPEAPAAVLLFLDGGGRWDAEVRIGDDAATLRTGPGALSEGARGVAVWTGADGEGGVRRYDPSAFPPAFVTVAPVGTDAVLSHDGAVVAFTSTAPLAAEDAGADADIYRVRVGEEAGGAELVSTDVGGTARPGDAANPAMDATGDRIAFDDTADHRDGGTDALEARQVWLRGLADEGGGGSSTVRVTPSDGLARTGQMVTVTVDDLGPNDPVLVQQCGADAGVTVCEPAVAARADDGGRVTHTHRVDWRARTALPEGCHTGCRLRVTTDADAPVEIGTHPLTFRGDPTAAPTRRDGLLRPGDLVTVTGGGWSPDSDVTILQCSGATCAELGTGRAGDTGSFTATVPVHYRATGSGGDCVAPCEISARVVTDGFPYQTFTQVTYAAAPAISLDRSAGLARDGEPVTVTGVRWGREGAVGLSQCTAAGTCTPLRNVAADASGAFTATVTPTLCDGCVIRAQEAAAYISEVAISFAAPDAPSLQVEPSTGLPHVGQRVTVTAANLPPGPYTLSQCTGIGGERACVALLEPDPGAEGAFSEQRFLRYDGGGPIGACDAPCSLVVGNDGGDLAEATITFGPAPTFAADPTSGLDPAGAAVAISGAGYAAGPVLIGMCSRLGVAGQQCTGISTVTADPGGAFDVAELAVDYHATSGGVRGLDAGCRTPCVLGAFNGEELLASTPITFDLGAPAIVGLTLDAPTQTAPGARSVAIADVPAAAIARSGAAAVASTPVRSVDLQASPVRSVPVRSVPVRSVPVRSVPVRSVALSSIPVRSVGWSAVLGDHPLSQVPLQTITLEMLLDATEETDANGVPTPEAAALAVRVDRHVRLGSTDLSSTALRDVSMLSVALGATPIRSVPLDPDPTANLAAWCGLIDMTVQECADLGIDADAPLLVFDLLGASFAKGGVASVPVRSVDLDATPIRSVPVRSVPVRSVALSATPIRSVPVRSVELRWAPIRSVPVRSVDLAATPIRSVPVRSVDLAATPIRSVPVRSVLIAATPVRSVPVRSVVIAATPVRSVPVRSVDLAATPIRSVPVRSVDRSVLDCQRVDCTTGTLEDVVAADGFIAGLTLGRLLAAIDPTEDLGTLGELLAAIDPQEELGLLVDLLAAIAAHDPTADLGTLGQLLAAIAAHDPTADLGTLGELLAAIAATQDLGTLGELLAAIGDPSVDLGDLGELLDAIKAAGSFDLGTLGELIVAILLAGDYPWEDLPFAAMGIQRYADDPGTVVFEAAYRIDRDEMTDHRLVAQLPPGFAALPDPVSLTVGTAVVDVDDVVTVAGTPTTGETVTVVANVDAAAADVITWRVAAAAPLALGEVAQQATIAVDTGGTPTTGSYPPITVTLPAADGPSTVERLAAADTLELGYLTESGEIDYYAIPAPPVGSRLSIRLSHLSADSDLVLYRADQAPGPSGADPRSVPVRSVVLDDERLGGGAVPPETLQDIPIRSVPIRSVSAQRSTADEEISITSTALPGASYILQVTGYNGATSDEPYVLRVRTTAPPPPLECTPTVLPSTPHAAAPAGSRADAQTLILLAEERLAATHGTAEAEQVRRALERFADRDDVRGVVQPVEQLPGAPGAYADWDADPCDADRANAVVNAITTGVTAFDDAHPDLQHVVIVGGDDLVPMARVQDTASLSNERDYAGEVGGVNAIAGAFATEHILTDDPYGDRDPIAWLNRSLYLPDLAVGRLVESPEDILRQLALYEAADGVLDASTALTTGYDFLTDGAEAVDEALGDRIGAQQRSTLIDDLWTRGDLYDALFDVGAVPEVAAVNAHFDHHRALPALGDTTNDESDLFTVGHVDAGAGPLPAELAAPTGLEGRIFFSMGCHAGLPVPDGYVDAGGPAQDWAQTLGSRGAVWFANTGYGYGDTAAVALSERLMARFAGNLVGGTVGEAVVEAKSHYFATLGVYGSYDEKALMEATFYGLPMYRLAETPSVQAASLSATPLLSTDTADGHERQRVTLTPAFTPHRTSGRGTYWSVGGDTQVTHHRPIQPRTDRDVTVAGRLAQGALITGLRSVDIVDVDPVFARPTVDLAANEPEISSDDVVFPTALTNLTTIGQGADRLQRLVVMPGQLIGTADLTATTGVQRLFLEVEADVLYAPPGAEGDQTPPTFSRIAATTVADGGAATAAFSVAVADDDPAGEVRRVLVLVRDTSNAWQAIDLVREGATWVGGAAVADERIEYFVQAVDAAGNVAVSTNKGRYFLAVTADAAGGETPNDRPPYGSTAPSPEEFAVVNAPAPGSFQPGPFALRVTGATYARIDGGGWETIAGDEVLVTGDGVHVVELADPEFTRLGVVEVGIDDTPPTIVIFSPVPDAVYETGAAVPADVACDDATSGIAVCDFAASVETGTSGDRIYTATATDRAGNVTTEKVRYRVADRDPPPLVFDGFFAPVANGTANVVKAGQAVPVKWTLTRGGVPVTATDPGTVSWTSTPVSCTDGSTPIPESETVDAAATRLHHDGTQYVLTFKTSKTWKGCRVLTLTFADGSTRSVLFRFR